MPGVWNHAWARGEDRVDEAWHRSQAHQQVNTGAATRGEWPGFCVKGAVFRAFHWLSKFDEIKHRQGAARDLN